MNTEFQHLTSDFDTLCYMYIFTSQTKFHRLCLFSCVKVQSFFCSLSSIALCNWVWLFLHFTLTSLSKSACQYLCVPSICFYPFQSFSCNTTLWLRPCEVKYFSIYFSILLCLLYSLYHFHTFCLLTLKKSS